MTITTIFLPRYLDEQHVRDHAVVVFDVLRATTTIVSAFAAGITAVRVFGNIDDLKQAAATATDDPLLCGEVNALPPPGFKYGNSPRQFNRAEHAGRRVYMSTTNGTRAILAARLAPTIIAAALVNADAAAARAAATKLPVTLLCSGTAGAISMEDAIGAGAVTDALITRFGHTPAEDAARICHRLFLASKPDLIAALSAGQGGHNVFAAKLQEDIPFAANLNALTQVPVVTDRENLVLTAN
jgi:2-phosphosulfolactate phosphatase